MTILTKGLSGAGHGLLGKRPSSVLPRCSGGVARQEEGRRRYALHPRASGSSNGVREKGGRGRERERERERERARGMTVGGGGHTLSIDWRESLVLMPILHARCCVCVAAA